MYKLADILIQFQKGMKSKKLILLSLTCFLLISSVLANWTTLTTSSSTSSKSVGTSILSTTSTQIVDNWNDKPGLHPEPITGTWPIDTKTSETVFVEDIDRKIFYEYTVTNLDCKIQIKIIDKWGKCWDFVIEKSSQLVFIDASNDIILIKRINSVRAVTALYVIKIRYSSTTQVFKIDCLRVNSIVDDEFFYFYKPWTIIKILEHNPLEKWIAIIKEDCERTNIYKINYGQRINVLLAVSWLENQNKFKITGGNSRVLFEKTCNTFWLDKFTCYDSCTPTQFNKVKVSDIGGLTYFDSNSVGTVDLVSWFFQYIQKSSDKKKLFTFLYWSYGSELPFNKQTLTSTCEIIYWFDGWSFFAAITNDDIYLTTVELKETSKTYQVYSNLLSLTCLDATKKAEILAYWKAAIKIVFIEGYIFVLTPTRFIVYSDCPKQWNKIWDKPWTSTLTDNTKILFKNIRYFYRNYTP